MCRDRLSGLCYRQLGLPGEPNNSFTSIRAILAVATLSSGEIYFPIPCLNLQRKMFQTLITYHRHTIAVYAITSRSSRMDLPNANRSYVSALHSSMNVPQWPGDFFDWSEDSTPDTMSEYSKAVLERGQHHWDRYHSSKKLFDSSHHSIGKA